MKCLKCGEEMDISIEILNPTAAVSDEALDRAVVFKCKKCNVNELEPTGYPCPKCGEKKLSSNVKFNMKTSDPFKRYVGHLKCDNCSWMQEIL